MEAIKLTGPVSWQEVDDERGEIIDALIRLNDGNPEELVVDTELDNYRYHIKLRSSDGLHFYGTWTCQSPSSNGEASGRLYRSRDGYFFFGQWTEEHIKNYWWMDLDIE